jgi:Fe-Mn family superoxide dismutase
VPAPAAQPAPTGPLVLPALPYDKAALEPSIDTETMEIHHDRHHKAYVDNGNKALAAAGGKWATMTPELIVASLAELPDDKRAAIRNNVGGHLNHTWFWKWMTPSGKGGGGEPTGALGDAINSTFGSFGGEGGFKEKFAAAGMSRFGSGWAWLIVTPDKKLAICSTANQDNPLMGEKIAGPGTVGTPILGLDVWEHAYYLKYRNLRAGYIKAWWDVVNWGAVSAQYAAGVNLGK